DPVVGSSAPMPRAPDVIINMPAIRLESQAGTVGGQVPAGLKCIGVCGLQPLTGSESWYWSFMNESRFRHQLAPQSTPAGRKCGSLSRLAGVLRVSGLSPVL